MSNDTALMQIKLLFSDLSRLWAFSRNLTNQNQEINAATKQLTCECSEADLEQAVTHYGATHIYESNDPYEYSGYKNNVTISAPSK